MTYHGILEREFAAVSQTSFCSLRYFRANLQPWNREENGELQCRACTNAKRLLNRERRRNSGKQPRSRVQWKSQRYCARYRSRPGRSFKQIMPSLDRWNWFSPPFCFRHIPLCLDRSFFLFFFFHNSKETTEIL